MRNIWPRDRVSHPANNKLGAPPAAAFCACDVAIAWLVHDTTGAESSMRRSDDTAVCGRAMAGVEVWNCALRFGQPGAKLAACDLRKAARQRAVFSAGVDGTIFSRSIHGAKGHRLKIVFLSADQHIHLLMAGLLVVVARWLASSAVRG